MASMNLKSGSKTLQLLYGLGAIAVVYLIYLYSTKKSKDSEGYSKEQPELVEPDGQASREFRNDLLQNFSYRIWRSEPTRSLGGRSWVRPARNRSTRKG